MIEADGSLHLRNFEVNLDELHLLQLPISPKFIFVGSVDVDVPLVHVTTEPTRVRVSEVFCLLTATSVPDSAEQARARAAAVAQTSSARALTRFYSGRLARGVMRSSR